MVGRLIQRPDRFQLNQNSDINVTPFVDVMMVLLIVFMVALPAATVSLKLDLPPAGKSALAEPVYVSLQRGGALFIGDKTTTLDTLSTDLAKRVGGRNPHSERVYVRADRSVRYGDFMRVVNRLHTDGFHAVGLINEQL
jgi:biopolymer transport protein ExbD